MQLKCKKKKICAVYGVLCEVSFFLNIFIDYAITVVSFPPPTPLDPAHPPPSHIPPP